MSYSYKRRKKLIKKGKWKFRVIDCKQIYYKYIMGMDWF